MDLNQAIKMVIEALQENVEDTADESKKLDISQASGETRLFGGGGLVDSMGVVILLSDLEDKLDEEFDIQVSLASDSAMSGTRSPFRTVNSLAGYIVSVVDQECAS